MATEQPRHRDNESKSRKLKRRRPDADDDPGLDDELDDDSDTTTAKPRRSAKLKKRRRDTRDDDADDVASDEADDNPDATKPEPRVETRRVDDLEDFPLQVELLDHGSEHEMDALTDDIQEHGMRDEPQILPENNAGFAENTIIDGHRRMEVWRALGKTKVRVLVRYDLANADRSTIEREFLQEKLTLRHLDPLAKARVALRLFEVERGRKRDKFRPDEETDARDRVGKTISMSGRNLQRYWSVLRIPRAIQDACRSGHIKLVDAAKVATLKKRQQQAIADRIDEGEDPKLVVKEYIVTPERKQPKPNAAVAVLARALRRAIDDLTDREDEVDSDAVIEVERELKKGRMLIKHLLALRDVDRADETESA